MTRDRPVGNRPVRNRSVRDRPVGFIGVPSARASWFYRLLLLAVRGLGRGVFGFRTGVVAAELLPRDASGSPAGGWIAAGLPHRTWVDPFILADNLPVEPRLAYFGDGPAIFRSRWRRFVFRRIGGVIPIWPGGGRAAVDAHLAAASQALAAGCVLCLFPETGPATPPGTARPLGLGVAYFALRTGAPVVPIVLGGSHELYRRRRFLLQVLPPMTARELAGLTADAALPEPWTPAERDAAHRIVRALHARTAEPIAAAHRATEPPAGVRKRWRWLTTAWH
ncbi:MAG TPA: 1-acyl-sn-glycerol-3-phosphate acyltransferase [Candidatus Limnocylindrales bacterium]|nr:1-acyl-sn-glycerol-3-phosphate acyltransferase [Candidatus Limnocylindrales bacterium]